jgi:hypothetical protein
MDNETFTDKMPTEAFHAFDMWVAGADGTWRVSPGRVVPEAKVLRARAGT